MDYSLFLVKFTKEEIVFDNEITESKESFYSPRKEVKVQLVDNESDAGMSPNSRLSQMNKDSQLLARDFNEIRLGTQVNKSRAHLSLKPKMTIKRSNVKRGGKKVTEFKIVK